MDQPPALRRDARDNLARLTEAAVLVFTERGLGAPLDEIARRAGVSQGTLYNRFGGREALIDAVLPTLVRTRFEELVQAVLPVADPAERFDRYVRGLCELQVSDHAFGDVMSSRFADSAEVEALCTRTLQVADEMIAAGMSTGVLRADLGSDDIKTLLVATAAIVREYGPEGAAKSQRMATLFLAATRIPA